jgi:thiamine-monophosphate kinase
MDEFSFIEYLKKTIPKSGRVKVGIGDDAAVMGVGKGKKLVVSTDVIVESVDFKIKDLSPEKIGRKALAINLSDIAAMGASPTAFVISIGRPPYISDAWLKRFYSGLLALAGQYEVVCVGGDFSKSKEFFASVTIFGEVLPRHIVKRSGAKPGDWVGVTGKLGGSILSHHYDFTPRVREGLFLSEKNTPTAMIDISDGLVQDLSHILKASRVGAVLELDKIPVSNDAFRERSTNVKRTCSFDLALERALTDGEDFELLFTVSPCKKMMLEKSWRRHFPKVPLSWIGKIEGKASRISWCRNGKKVSPPNLSMKGFSHF